MRARPWPWLARRRGRPLTWLALGLLLWVPHAGAAELAVVNTDGLSFGRFAAGSGGAVQIGPSGLRSASGGVVLLSSASGGAARFDISGDPHRTYAIGLPADGEVSLVDAAGRQMPLTHFTSQPSAFGTLDASGRQTLAVGARLQVGAVQPSGTYSASFTIHVDYN